MAQWNPAQVLALAPDPSSAKSGRELAAPRKWVNLGQGETLVWGECQGSGKDPYRVCVDLTEPAFSCSCPSRKFPCKHGLGLLLMLAQNEAAIKTAQPPEWAAKWVEGRAARAQKRAEKTTNPAPSPVRDEEAREKRQAKRETRVGEGIAELGRWLEDLMRQGLADIQGKPQSYWSNLAARMIDAQAPGLAARVLELGGVPASGVGWEARFLEDCAQLHLLLRAYANLETLPESVKADVKTTIGWVTNQDDLARLPAVSSVWSVIGHRTIEESHIRTQRIWLWSNDLGREALVLHFMAANQMPDFTFPPGHSFTGEVVFYPGAFSQRGIIRSRQSLQPTTALRGSFSIKEIIAAHGLASAEFPWLRARAFILDEVVATESGQRFWVVDRAGQALPVHAGFGQTWELVALGGARPMQVFGEFDGQTIWPLSVIADGRFISLSS